MSGGSAMATTTEVKVTVTPEAAARVAELGLQKEFDQLVERARTTIQGVRWIDVQLEPPYDTGDEDQVVLWIRIANNLLLKNPSIEQLRTWKLETFSPDVCWHISTVPTVVGYDS
jgi:hypothetical protein